MKKSKKIKHASTLAVLNHFFIYMMYVNNSFRTSYLKSMCSRAGDDTLFQKLCED